MQITDPNWKEEAERIYNSALTLHAAGLSLFPLTHPLSRPGEDDAGKKPLVEWKQFQRRRPTDEEVRNWFGNVRGPKQLCNIGLALGPISGVIVIDADSPGARAGLSDDGYPVPPKWVETARGEHWYYGWDERHPIGNRAKINVGGAKAPVDVRGQGGYVVAPGSLHKSGHVYELHSESDVPWAQLPPLPEEVSVKIEKSPAVAVTTWTPRIEESDKIQALIEMCASGKTRLFIERGAPRGERNDQIYRAARDLNGLGIPEAYAIAALLGNLDHAADERDGFTETIKSAYKSPSLPSFAFGLVKVEDVHAAQKAALKVQADEPVKHALPPLKDIEEPKSEAPVTDASAGTPARTVATLRDAAGQHEVFSNVESIMAADDDGKTEQIDMFKQPRDIVNQLLRIGGGYPKVIGRTLFTIEHWNGRSFLESSNIRYLSNESGSSTQLFGWISAITKNGVYWKDRGAVRASVADKTLRTPMGKSDLAIAAITLNPEVYRDVCPFPTWPIIPRCFYLYPSIPDPSPGFECLERWIDLFNPLAEEDRVVMRALTLTMFWGAPPGLRPCFVIQSQYGQGAGKTSTADAMSAVAGGPITLGAQGGKEFLEPALTPEGLLKRVIVIDNAKGKIEGQAIESLITSSVIAGRVNYIGPVSRANYCTVIFTTNAPRFSTDMAQRSVVIDIGAPKHEKDFKGVVARFLEANHAQLIADILGVLKGPVVGKIDGTNGRMDRWQLWIQEILCRCRGFEGALSGIQAKRENINSDFEEAREMEICICQLAVKLGKRAECIDKGAFDFKTSQLYAFMDEAGTLPDKKMSLASFGGWMANRSSNTLRKITRSGLRSWWKFEVGRERMQELFSAIDSIERGALFAENKDQE